VVVPAGTTTDAPRGLVPPGTGQTMCGVTGQGASSSQRTP
jgi:hypothetical protein